MCLLSQHTQRPLTKSISEVGSSTELDCLRAPELEALTWTFCPQSPNFYGVKSAKFGLDFRPQSPLTRCHSETIQHVCKLKCAVNVQMIALYILQIWRSLVHAPPRTQHCSVRREQAISDFPFILQRDTQTREHSCKIYNVFPTTRAVRQRNNFCFDQCNALII